MIVEQIFTLCDFIAGILAGLIPNPIPAWFVSSVGSLGYILGWCRCYSVFVPWDVLLDMTFGLIMTATVYFGYHMIEHSLYLISLINPFG